jgi:hypothetical protein
MQWGSTGIIHNGQSRSLALPMPLEPLEYFNFSPQRSPRDILASLDALMSSSHSESPGLITMSFYDTVSPNPDRIGAAGIPPEQQTWDFSPESVCRLGATESNPSETQLTHEACRLGADCCERHHLAK